MYKALFRIGLIAYLGLLILSVIFYKQRVVLLDDALFLFNLVKNNGFAIEHSRYIATLPQILPVIARWLSLPIETIAMVYSVSYIVYWFAGYLLCGLVFKNHKMGVALLLCHILITTHTFFWIVSEILQGITLLVVVLAYLDGKRWADIAVAKKLLIGVVIITLVFAHPLMVFPFCYALLFWARQQHMPIKKLLVAMLFYFGIVLLKALFLQDHYELSGMGGLRNFITYFPNYFNLYSNRHFLQYCADTYYWIPLCCILIIAVYIIQKQWARLLVFACFMLAYLLLINVCFATDTTPDFYIENLYLPLGFFIALPLVYDILPVVNRPALTVVFVGLMVFSIVARVWTVSGIYTDRLTWERSFLSQHQNEKLLIAEKRVPGHPLIYTWASSYEFWLLSALEQRNTAFIIIKDEVQKAVYFDDNKLLITNWGAFRYNELPKQYFPFTDTTTYYTVLR